MAELRATTSASVSVPPERVWDLLCDTTRYAEWSTATDEVTRTDGPAREGSTYDEINPVLGPWRVRSHWTVTEFVPPRRQVHRGHGLPLTSSFEIVFDLAAVGDSASEVTLSVRGRSTLGPLGAVFARVMRGQVERDTRKSLQNLVELAAYAPSPASRSASSRSV